MQADNHSKSTPQFFQTNDPLALAALIEAALIEAAPGRTIIELGPGPAPLTPKAALALGALACEYLLTGEPELCTFDAADLEQAIDLLRHAARLRSAGRAPLPFGSLRREAGVPEGGKGVAATIERSGDG